MSGRVCGGVLHLVSGRGLPSWCSRALGGAAPGEWERVVGAAPGEWESVWWALHLVSGRVWWVRQRVRACAHSPPPLPPTAPPPLPHPTHPLHPPPMCVQGHARGAGACRGCRLYADHVLYRRPGEWVVCVGWVGADHVLYRPPGEWCVCMGGWGWGGVRGVQACAYEGGWGGSPPMTALPHAPPPPPPPPHTPSPTPSIPLLSCPPPPSAERRPDGDVPPGSGPRGGHVVSPSAHLCVCACVCGGGGGQGSAHARGRGEGGREYTARACCPPPSGLRGSQTHPPTHPTLHHPPPHPAPPTQPPTHPPTHPPTLSNTPTHPPHPPHTRAGAALPPWPSTR